MPIVRRCIDCDLPFNDDRTATRTTDGDYVCDDCISEHDYSECNDCAEMSRSLNDDGYCDRCQDNRDDEIHYRDVDMSSNPEIVSQSYGTVVKSNRKFGIELEMQFDSRSDGGHMTHEIPGYVGVSDDGSISGFGLEIQTPPASGIKAETLIEKVCKVANTNDASVDSSCGFHLHVDYADIDELGLDNQFRIMRMVWLFYIAFEDVLMSFLPDTRRKNTYCNPLRSEYHYKEVANAYDLDALEKLWYRVTTKREVDQSKGDSKHGSRYRGINMHTLLSGRHLEVRFHSGTINPRKILEWANLHLTIADKAVGNGWIEDRLRKACNNIDLSQKTKSFFDYVKLEPASEAYFRERQKKFMAESKQDQPDLDKKLSNDAVSLLAVDTEE